MNNPRLYQTLMLLILLLGLVWRFHGLVWTLPFYFFGDETRVVLNGVTLHQTGTQNYQESLTIMSNYPPYRSWEVAAMREILMRFGGEDAARNAMLMLTGRMFSLYYSLLLIALIYQLGKAATARPAVGLVAALFVALWDQMVFFGQRTLADGAGMMFMVGSAWLAVLAYQKQRYAPLVFSLFLGILGGLGKYNYLPVLVLPALAGLSFFVKNPQQFITRVLLPSLLILIPVGLAARQTVSTDDLYYQFLNERAQLEGALRRAQLEGSTPDSPEWRAFYEIYPPNPLVKIAVNYQVVLDFLPPLILPLMLLGAGFVASRRGYDKRLMGVLGGVALLFWLSFSVFRIVEGRQLFGAILLGLIFMGIALVELGRVSSLAGAALLGLLIIPLGAESWRQNIELSKPDTRVETVNWLLENAQAGTGVVLENEPYEFWATNGYDFETQFNVTRAYRLFEQEPPAWENQGYYYLIADAGYAWRGGYYAGHEKQALWDQYVEVVARFEGDHYAGPDRIIMRAFRPHVKVDAVFGEGIHFYGYTLESQTIQAGESLKVKYFWWAKTPPAEDYLVFNHVMREGELIAQVDRLAGHNGTKPSSLWEKNEWLFDHFEIPIPPQTPAGIYQLQIGLYRSTDGARLSLAESPDGILNIAEIQIEREAPNDP